ncbi:MAG TPA: GNAT family N-acetyltransferase, partial [Chloroflexota bacterium]|nr:GNAT family N-acetyltransferase [Chloroflexota bacterium]
MNASPSPSGPDTAEHQIRITATADETGEAPGQTRVELLMAGHAVSRLYIVPFTIRIGDATVRMDGIAGVGTDEEHRNRGYARHILEAAVEHMRHGDAALTMLYGISDFYHRFGYTTAGPDHYIHLTHLEREPSLPPGWTVRPLQPGDLPSVQRLYDLNTRHAVGVAVRAPDSYIW